MSSKPLKNLVSVISKMHIKTRDTTLHPLGWSHTHTHTPKTDNSSGDKNVKKTVWQFLKTWNIELPCDLVIHLLYWRGMRHMPTQKLAHKSSQHHYQKSQTKLKASQMFINLKWINKMGFINAIAYHSSIK